MTENKKNLYRLIFKIALTYRLSLKNICILLGKEPTEENQKEIYNIFDLLFGDNYNYKTCYIFLFDYETKKEPDFISSSSLNAAALFFNKYKIASKNKDYEAIKRLNEQLDSLDKKVKTIRFRDKDTELTEDDYLAIITYRIKYSLLKKDICQYLDISQDTLKIYEDKIENSKLKYKIDKLNDFCLDLKNQKYKGM